MLHVAISADYPGKPNVLREVTFDLARGVPILWTNRGHSFGHG